jgi:hypothetical protein
VARWTARWAAGLGLALGLGFGAVAAQAAPVVLTPQQARVDGFKALALGDAKLAHQFALVLLKRDKHDFAALILRARSARELGHMAEARAAARAAWAEAKPGRQSYDAALVRAQVLSSSGYRTVAQFWLRRAIQLAPSDRDKAVAVKGLRYVRSHSHWAFRLDASLQPSSNVNGGSANSTMTIFGLPFLLSGDAQALSGVVGSLGFTARYRFKPTENRLSTLRFSVMQTHNWLSADAKRQAPTARGSNYDYADVELGFSQRLRRSVKSLAIYHWDVKLGRNWYGGKGLSNYVGAGVGVERPLNASVTGGADLSVQRQLRNDVFSRSAVVTTGSAGLTFRLKNRDRVKLTLGDQDTHSKNIQIDHNMIFAQLSWDRAKPIRGVRIGAALQFQRSQYGFFPFSPDGRTDYGVTASLTAVFDRVQYMGFSPSVTLQWNRVHSNVSLYETRNIGIGVGIRSTF